MRLSETARRWKIRKSDDDQLIASFQAVSGIDTYPLTIYRGVAVVSFFSGRSGWAVAYRQDGKTANIANDFVFKVFHDGNFMAFDTGEGAKVLDIDSWTIKKFPGENVVGFHDGKLIGVDRSAKPAVRIIGIADRQTQVIPVPEWKWGAGGMSVCCAKMTDDGLLMVDSAGTIYALDATSGTFVREFLATSDEITGMEFSEDRRFFATFATDGFIRIWAVVPEGANVR